MDQMAAFGGMMIGVMLVMTLVGLLVAGLVLKVSVRLVEGFSPSYGRSVLAVLLAGIALFVVNLGVMVVMGAGLGATGAMGADADPAAAMAAMGSTMLVSTAVSLVGGLLITALAVNVLVKHPGGRSIGFGRACLVALLYLVVMVVLGIILSIGFGIVLGLLGLGAAGMAGG